MSEYARYLAILTSCYRSNNFKLLTQSICRHLSLSDLLIPKCDWLLCVFSTITVTTEISWLHNNYSMSPSWIWSDKTTNSRYALVGYNHFISNKGEWNNCFSKFSNWVLLPIFISTLLQSVKFLNLAHYFPYDAKLRLLAHSQSFFSQSKS